MRRRELWWAASLTLGLHAGVLWWAWSEAPPRLASTSVVYVEAVLLTNTGLKPSAAETSLGANIAQAPPSSPESLPRPKPQSAYIAPPKQNAPPEPIGYLPFDAVDQAAEPLGDWMIDTDLLPPGRSLRVVLKLWISATGVIDHWDFSGVVGDEEKLARRALSNLPQTLIQPAFLNHLPVPSFRQLEIVLLR